jgi:DNA-directed RNA polymerase specialized sigma24 family protein
VDIAALLERFAKGPPGERVAVAQELARRFESVFRLAWECSPEASASMTSDAFVEAVLTELFADLGKLRAAKAFPYLLLKTIERVVDNAASAAGGLVLHPQSGTEPRSPGLDKRVVDALLVRAYLHHLARRTRQVLELEFEQEQDIDAIARTMGLTKSGVRTSRQRGLGSLRVILNREAHGLRARKSTRTRR